MRASVNGDLFWTARDIVRNLGVLATAQNMDEWSPREIHNQNDLFVQPMLIRARTAIETERRLAEAYSDRLLVWASGLIIAGAGRRRHLGVPADGKGDPPRL